MIHEWPQKLAELNRWRFNSREFPREFYSGIPEYQTHLWILAKEIAAGTKCSANIDSCLVWLQICLFFELGQQMYKVSHKAS